MKRGSALISCSSSVRSRADGGGVLSVRQIRRSSDVRKHFETFLLYAVQSIESSAVHLNDHRMAQSVGFFLPLAHGTPAWCGRLLEPLVWDYRKDVWCLPLTSLLQMGLRCAYLSARPAEYAGHVVELCSPIAVVAAADRTRPFAHLVAILEVRVAFDMFF